MSPFAMNFIRIVRATTTASWLFPIQRCGIGSTAAFCGRRKNDGGRRAIVEDALKEEENDPGYAEALEGIEEMMGAVWSRSRRAADLRREAAERRRRQTKSRIVEQNLAKLDSRPANVLTWAAKRQIVELATEDGHLWTPAALSACFPASAEQIARLINGRVRIPQSPAAIYKHDRIVLRRLKELAAADKLPDGIPDPDNLDPSFEWLLTPDRWGLLIHADGNTHLPLPERQAVEERLEEKAKKTMGPFETLVNCLSPGRGQEKEKQEKREERLIAKFAAHCDAQRRQVRHCLTDFTTEDHRRQYVAAGVLPEPPAPSSSASVDGFNMFDAMRSNKSAPGEEDRRMEMVARLVEQLEQERPEVTVRRDSSSKVGKMRPGKRPIGLQERSKMDFLRIFRYSFTRRRPE